MVTRRYKVGEELEYSKHPEYGGFIIKKIDTQSPYGSKNPNFELRKSMARSDFDSIAVGKHELDNFMRRKRK